MTAPWQKATAVDLFCGAGGLTRGLLDAGIQVAAGYDVDRSCRFPYETNNKPARFIEKSVTELKGAEVLSHFPPYHFKILVGCAPCQTFSKYTQGLDNSDDPKWTLLNEFGRLVREVKPDIVSMENVPEIQRHAVFDDFLEVLRDEGFQFDDDPKARVVYCPDYGIAQQRKRFVLLASRHGDISLIPKSHPESKHPTVASVIENLPHLPAGGICSSDPVHRSCRLSPTNLERIKCSKPGGTWRDWPEKLVAACHRKEKGSTYPSVYGRMEWDKPSPTVTTQFFGYGNGRFGHPEQNRALSLREGALLQSFPVTYKFFADESECSFATVGRLIGNAVPVRLGEVVGISIVRHLRSSTTPSHASRRRPA